MTRPSLYVTKTPTKTHKRDKINDIFFYLDHSLMCCENATQQMATTIKKEAVACIFGYPDEWGSRFL
jgi:hypothetical protein